MKQSHISFFLKIWILAAFLTTPTHHITGNTSFPTTECPTVPLAWYDDVSVEGFSLSWEEVPGAVEYYIEVWINGTIDFAASTENINIGVEFSSSLEAGDVIEYHIFTVCNEGTSQAYSDKFFIIDTVDVVMGMNIPPSQVDCQNCPYVINTSIPQNGLYSYYDCPCVQSSGWASTCKINGFSFQINACRDDRRSEEGAYSLLFHPNPFSSSTQLNFQIHEPAYVSLKILDINGQEVYAALKGKLREPGNINIQLDGNHFKKGLYFYELIINQHLKSGRLVKL